LKLDRAKISIPRNALSRSEPPVRARRDTQVGGPTFHRGGNPRYPVGRPLAERTVTD
jgi:hypothetical protein